MTKILEEAFSKARTLPQEDQDAIGSIVLQEIEADRHWDELFANPRSADLLAKMADLALAHKRVGNAKPLDVNDL